MKQDKFMKSMEKLGKNVEHKTKKVAGHLLKTKHNDIRKSKK